MMTKYEREIENLKDNIHYGNCVSFNNVKEHIEFGFVKIDKKLFRQTHLLIFLQQTKDQQIKSQIQIEKLRLEIKNKTDDFPAIAIIRHPTYNFVADGNHRVYALYKEGVTMYEAIYIKRK